MAEDDHLGVGDLGISQYWAELAGEHWAKTSKASKAKKIKPEVIKKKIWDVLEQENFHFRSLLMLESLQLLEKYTTSPILAKQTDWRLAIYGQAIPKTRRIIMYS